MEQNQPVQSEAMFCLEQEAFRYPLLDIPPVAHCPLRIEGGKRYIFSYAGTDIVTLELPEGVSVRCRKGSDGVVQSSPLIQQLGFAAEKEVEAVVRLRVRKDGFCMRPRRAQGPEAILAQSGRPLLYQVNGFYGVWEDILLEWYGTEWNWTGPVCTVSPQGETSAEFRVKLGPSPFLLLIKPRYYGQHLGYRYYQPWERRPNPKPVSGWCSWEAFHNQVTQKDIEETADWLKQLVPYGLEYLQIDDGYEQPLIPPEGGKIQDAWLTPNQKFPGGHEAIISSCVKNGIRPGVWTNSCITNEEAADSSPYCFQQGGKAIRGDWIQFILTCTPDVLRQEILPYYQELSAKGYAYFKADAMRHLLLDGLKECVRRGILCDDEADRRYRAYYETIRQGIGKDAYLLSCWGGLTPCVGIADACRVATDANPNWPAIQMQIEDTARWFFAQRVLFTVDPDHICARTKPEWARTLLSFVSLTGGIYMLSDAVSCYDPSRMQDICRTLPAQEVYTAETGNLDYTFPAFPGITFSDTPEEYAERTQAHWGAPEHFGTLWATHYAAGSRRWTVVCRTALNPLPDSRINLENIGLEPGRPYALYDFWEEKYLGCCEQSIPVHELPLGSSQVIAVVPLQEGLNLIGSTRHVSMDTVSVMDYHQSAEKLSMKVTFQPGRKIRYTFWGKGDWRLHTCQGGAVSLSQEGNLVTAEVLFTEKEAALQLEKV